MHRDLVVAALAVVCACAPKEASPGIAANGSSSAAASPTPAVPSGAPSTAAEFEPEIRAFEAADSAHPPARGGVMFVGSSSIRMWPDVAADFPGTGAVNRGFGGSTMTDVTYFAPRVVLPRRPRLIVLYAGDNDIAAGHAPSQVLADYQAFAREVHDSLPSTRIVYVSIKPSPSRWIMADSIRRANTLIAGAIAHDPRARFVDVFTPMLSANGHPRPELFRDDSLHMTARGYALWREKLRGLVR
jgi:lysophospholipase L1-like esterase